MTGYDEGRTGSDVQGQETGFWRHRLYSARADSSPHPCEPCPSRRRDLCRRRSGAAPRRAGCEGRPRNGHSWRRRSSGRSPAVRPRRPTRSPRGTVKFSGSVADLADETRHAERPWISIPTRHYQPRRLAVSPLRCERSRCRRSPGPTRHDGVLRSDPAVVPHGRFSIRSPAHASTGPAGRHLAPGRGLRHHPGTAALSLACRRSRWGRHRYPRPVASRLSGGYTLVPQAVEGPGAYAWAGGHRQAEQLTGLRPERSCRPSPIARTDTRTIAPTSPTSPHGNASATCAGAHLPGRHNDSCPCLDSSATSSALAVTWCERCIIGSDEDALFSLRMQSRSPPDAN